MRIRKRDGSLVLFDEKKIQAAVLKALSSVGMPSESVADKVTRDVVAAIKPNDEPTVEGVQDIVELALMKRGLGAASKAYILYRDERARARKSLAVRSPEEDKQSITDKGMLLVQSLTSNRISGWDRRLISDCLVTELGMPKAQALAVAKAVEDGVIATGLKTVNSALIREMVNSVLMDRQYSGQLRDMTMYKVPRDFLDSLMHDKSKENSNIIANNPEAVNMAISELVLKQYALDAVFSPDVRSAHVNGGIHLHDASMPHRVYCGSHSIEYLKKYGLSGMSNLSTTSKPAKTASVLTGHLNTFLASMQAYYAGALGLGYVNVLYAPMLIGLNNSQLRQTAQELIFNGSQNAFSRGGQTLFIDINVNPGVPGYMKDTPAIGPGGKYMFLPAAAGSDISKWQPLDERQDKGCWRLVWQAEDKSELAVVEESDGVFSYTFPELGKVLTYGDFAKETMAFAHALLDIWEAGDANGRVFEFPKCDFHVSSEMFTDAEQMEVFEHACRVAASNGSPYFVFDRDSVTLASCCRLRVQVTDKSMLRHPERLRTTGMQNVTINIPQAAYRARHNNKGTVEGLLEEIDSMMELAVKAHHQKKSFVDGLMKDPANPLWQLGKTSCDGSPYLDTAEATYIIGFIGVNDAVQYLSGEQLHESQAALNMGLGIVGHMYLKAKELSEKHGLQFKLEESPAESAARRLARSDLMRYREDAMLVYKGEDEDQAYYTNSSHLAPDAPVDLIERAEVQAKFNPVIEAGAITHAFIGEERPDPDALADIVTKVFLRTQSAQLVFSPEFTYCNDCFCTARGLRADCPSCGSGNVIGETRIVGYFSRVSSWNLSKLAELRARQRGNYRVAEVKEGVRA